jgi:hypothetical protein
MSTKTTFKRVALVAVAALGLSLVAVAPSNAASLQKITLGTLAGVQTTTGTTNVEVKTLVNINGYCDATGPYANTNYMTVYTALPTTSRIGLPSLRTLAWDNNDYSQASSFYAPTESGMANGRIENDGDYSLSNPANYIHLVCNNAGRYNAFATLAFTPDVPGTYSLLIQDPTASYTQTTWTVVVTNPTVKSSTAFINTNLAADSTSDAGSLAFTAPANVTAKARVTVKQYSTTDTTTIATAAISGDVVVAISKGLVSKTNDYFAAAKSVTTAAATAATNNYYVFANGEVGSADLTVTVGGTLVSTKKITFQGLAATMTAALTTGQNTWIAPSTTATLTVGSKDSAGNASSNTPTITVTSSNTAVATAARTTDNLVTISGVVGAAGTSVITVADAAGTATSATYTVTVAPAISATLPTMTFDKTEYAAGELMTITIAAAAADNATFAAFAAAPTTSVNVVTVKNPFLVVDSVQTGRVALVSGKATWTAYAPITAGPITVTATSSTGSSATAAAVTATATVLSDGVAQAAADAAAEAIDAANAATDAANAAAEAADAATAAAQDAADAVAALSVQVSEEIAVLKAQNDALRKQLIALTNLIIKIQKKVKA